MYETIENIALISSAGAGKTRALTQRFLLLFLHDTRYPLDSLYGITFTNEAAFEMKTRILRYLDLLRTGTVAEESERAIVKEFTRLFPDIAERAEKGKRYLLNNLSELNVSTFHSLFSSFLSSIPFAAGILPGYKVIDETEEAFIFQSVLTRFFERITEAAPEFVSIAELLEQRDVRLKQSFQAVYSSVVPWLPFLEHLVKEERYIRTTVPECAKLFAQSLKACRDYIYTHSTGQAHLDKLLDMIDGYIETQDFRDLTSSEYTRSILAGDIINKTYMRKFIDGLGRKSSAFQKILEQLKERAKEYLISLSDQQILIHLKPILEVHRLFQTEKQKQNVISFDDIETYTLEALRNNPEPDYLYFKIGAELRHLMIDEFQDTSHRQLEVIEPLISEITSVAPEEKSIFYVGDPKQAIFRWRGGTSELFYTLMQKYPGKIKAQELLVNHRSTAEIVDFVNTVLDKKDKARPDNTGGWIRVALCGSFEHADEGKEAVMERTSRLIQELHKDYGYEYSDIAVLVRTNAFGAAVAEQLTKNGIRCISRSRADILSDNDVRFIINLVKFLDNPQNDFALLHVLLSSVFAMKEETLRRLKHRKTLFLSISDSHPSWAVTKKLSKLLSLVHFLNPYELVYAIYKELGLRISYSLATLLDASLEYTHEGSGYLSDFIEWLERVGTSIEIKEVHHEGVKVLTVHKAKGLEFEVVVLPETHTQVGFYENRQLLFSFEDGGSKPAKVYWRAYGKYFGELTEAEKRRLASDELNLLYVALTRAKKGLHILGFRHATRGSGFWFDTITRKIGSEDYSRCDIQRKPRIEGVKKLEKPYGTLSDEHALVKEERTLYSPTERGLEIIDAARRQRITFGSIVHDALSRLQWLDDVVPERFVDDAISLVKNLYGRTSEQAIEIENTLRPLLEETITDPGLRFIFHKDHRMITCKNELPIYFEEKNRDVSAHIDRLLVEPEVITIIDYKTGEEKPEDKHQINIYRKGIQKMYPDKTVKAYVIYLEKKRGEKISES